LHCPGFSVERFREDVKRNPKYNDHSNLRLAAHFVANKVLSVNAAARVFYLKPGKIERAVKAVAEGRDLDIEGSSHILNNSCRS